MPNTNQPTPAELLDAGIKREVTTRINDFYRSLASGLTELVADGHLSHSDAIDLLTVGAPDRELAAQLIAA